MERCIPWCTEHSPLR